jgi:hypothetical protein
LGRGLADSAASRAYYAAYHALWWNLEKNGRPAPRNDRGERFWPHKSVAAEARKCGRNPLDQQMQEDFETILWEARVKADYYPEPVLEVEARDSIETAKAVLESVQRRRAK